MSQELERDGVISRTEQSDKVKLKTYIPSIGSKLTNEGCSYQALRNVLEKNYDKS